MPDLNDQHKAVIDQANDYFTGEPNRNLIKAPEDGEGEGEAAAAEANSQNEEAEAASEVSEEAEIQVPPKDLLEIDRVNYVVHAIENDCQIAPCGAFKMTSKHEVCRNEAFKGLDTGSAL